MGVGRGLFVRMIVRVGAYVAVFLGSMLLPAATAIAQGQLSAASVRPAEPPFEPARAAFEALSGPDRRAIQEDLIFTGDLSGTADGNFGRLTFEAIIGFQRSARQDPTGILDARGRAALQAAARRAREASGFTIVDDSRTGLRIGIPERLLPKHDVNPNGGSRWQSADERITLDTRAITAGDVTLQSLYDRNLAIRTPGRQVTYKLIRPDFFVISGETPTGRFFTRYASGPEGLRGFSIGYDKALAHEVDRLVVAIANSFTPFPTASAQATAPAPAEAAAPSAPQLVATGLAIAPRRIVTAAPVEGCGALTANGSRARVLPVAGPLRIVEPDESLSAALPPLRAEPLSAGTELVALFFMLDRGRPALIVAPASFAADGAVAAPLQHGASGAPLVDRAGRLAGFVGELAWPRFTAGISPAARHPFVVASASDVIPGGAMQPGAGPAQGAGARSTGELAAGLRPAIVPLLCGS
jgi:peptidoglycan hydrolase-like protein with peptidoglycan-binding domain